MKRSEFERQQDQDEAQQALLEAAHSRSAVGIRRAIRLGAEIDFVDMDGLSALMEVCGSSSGGACVSALLELGADIEQTREDGKTPLLVSLIRGSEQGFKALMSAGADPNHVDLEGRSPLYFALFFRMEAEAIALLDAGANIQEQGGSLDIVILALRCGPGAAERVLSDGPRLGLSAPEGLLGAIAKSELEDSEMKNVVGLALEWAEQDASLRRDEDGDLPHESAARARGPASMVSEWLLSAYERRELEAREPGSVLAASRGARL